MSLEEIILGAIIGCIGTIIGSIIGAITGYYLSIKAESRKERLELYHKYHNILWKVKDEINTDGGYINKASSKNLDQLERLIPEIRIYINTELGEIIKENVDKLRESYLSLVFPFKEESEGVNVNKIKKAKQNIEDNKMDILRTIEILEELIKKMKF